MDKFMAALVCGVGLPSALVMAQTDVSGATYQHPEYPLSGGYQTMPYNDPIEFDVLMGVMYDHFKENYANSRFFKFGSSAAMGDFDGDGDLDLAVGVEMTPNRSNDGVSDLSRTGAGAVCVFYGPISDWPKRVGTMADSPAPTGFDGWWNAFDFSAVSTNETAPSGGEIESLMIYSETGTLKLRAGTTPTYDLHEDDYIIINGGQSVFDVDSSSDQHDAYNNEAVFSPGGTPLSGSWTFVESNTQVGDGLGYAISFVGDVDDDGTDDLLIGAPNFNRENDRPTSFSSSFDYLFLQPFDEENDGDYDSNDEEVRFNQNSFGAAFLVFGKSGTRLTGKYTIRDIGIDGCDEDNTENLSKTYPLQGVRFLGGTIHDKVGQDVRNGSLGMNDINGDDFADFLIGAQTFDSGDHPDPNADLNAIGGQSTDSLSKNDGVGACYIIYGADEDWNTTYELPFAVIDDELPNDGAVIYGSTAFGYLGYCGFAGDFDNNGYTDVIIGSPNEDIYDSWVDGNGVRHPSADSGASHGESNTGAVYIVFGYGNGHHPVGEYFTSSAGASNISSLDVPGEESKPIYARTTRDINSSSPILFSNRPVAIKIAGNENKARDYDENNTSDHPDFDSGHAWSSTWYDSTTIGSIVESEDVGAEFGWSVMAAGDVDADGYADVLIGAPDFIVGAGGADDGSNDRTASNTDQPDSTGKVYLVFGFDPADQDTSDTWSHAWMIDDLVDFDTSTSDDFGADPTPATLFLGEHIGDNLGWHVFCAGNINNDYSSATLKPYADFVLGANEGDILKDVEGTTDPEGVPTVGSAYLVYGGDHLRATAGNPLVFDLADLGSESTFFPGARIYGDSYYAEGYGLTHYSSNKFAVSNKKPRLGTWVFGGFDINDDGYDDFGVCAPNAAMPFETESKPMRVGAVYMFYGSNVAIECDLDGDGDVDCVDYWYYHTYAVDPGTNPNLVSDMTGDGEKDEEDLAYIQEFIDTACDP